MVERIERMGDKTINPDLSKLLPSHSRSGHNIVSALVLARTRRAWPRFAVRYLQEVRLVSETKERGRASQDSH